MIGNYFARLTGSKRNLLALLASSVVLTAGCANMSMAPTGVNPLSSPAALSGKIRGGNQPVVGATVQLWYMGQTPSAPQLAATTTSDSLGSFVFTRDSMNGNAADDGTTSTYSCPTGTDPLVYVLSKGGNTQNNGDPTQTNSAAGFIAIYDDCSKIGPASFVYLSEVTTVATMAAVTQFFNPVDETLSADGTGQQKIIVDNLRNTVALLASSTTGLAVPSTVIPAVAGGNSNVDPAVTLTATPEPGKVNLLANIISACVNSATSSGTACTSLFTAAVHPIPDSTSFNPPSFGNATDTLQALYYMFTNPSSGSTANVATLFGLAGGSGAPYQPSAAQPTDWTIGISYASTSTCSSSGGFINSPIDVNIDAQDTVWIANSQTGGNLSAINAAGAPYTCINLDAGASSGGATVDQIGNIWFGAGTSIYRYSPSTKAALAFPVTVPPLGVTADGLNNVYFTAVAGTTGTLYQLPLAVTASSAVTPLPISNTVGPNPIRLMPDYQGCTVGGTPARCIPNPVDIWASSGSNFVSQVAPTGSTGGGVLNGYLTTPFSGSGNSYGLSVSRGNYIFSSSIDNGAINLLAPSGTTWITPSGWPFTAAASAGISSPTALAADPRQNSFIPNSVNGATTGSLSAVNFHASAQSPATGFQKDITFLHSGSAAAIDQAGNIWVVGSGNNFITEIVGAAVPVYQPYSAGIANGRFQSIP